MAIDTAFRPAGLGPAHADARAAEVHSPQPPPVTSTHPGSRASGWASESDLST